MILRAHTPYRKQHPNYHLVRDRKYSTHIRYTIKVPENPNVFVLLYSALHYEAGVTMHILYVQKQNYFVNYLMLFLRGFL